ncbi:RNA pseudouridine synthase 6 [Chlorella vulgaris]
MLVRHVEAPDPVRLMEALAIPPAPGFRTHGARVEHLLAPRDGCLADVITEALQLPQGAAELLLRFGAIHTCPVPPALSAASAAGMSAAELAEVQLAREAAQQRAGTSSQVRTTRRAQEGATTTRGAYIRVHLHPKRFPGAHAVDWAGRVVASTDEYVVVSKPAGVPSAPTVDNWLESAPACTAQASTSGSHRRRSCLCIFALLVALRLAGSKVSALALEQPLLLTSRLDQCTEGLLVLAKTRSFVARFNQLVQRSSNNSKHSSSTTDDGRSSDGNGGRGGGTEQQEHSMCGASSDSCAPQQRPLRKFYRAATAVAPPLGLLRHHLSIERRHQGLPSFTIAHDQAVEGSLLAELRVVEVAPIRLTAAATEQWGTPAEAIPVYECLIELLTGRTHQIRAQLAAVGCSLLGDSLYQPLVSLQLRQRLFAGDPCDDLRQGSADRLLREPQGGVGLQACRLEVADACMGGSRDAPALFDAGTPWWRA